MNSKTPLQIRVGLLIGNPELSNGRKMLIESQSDLNLVFIENSGERAIERLNDFNVDVLIVDQRTSDIDGLTFLKALYDSFLLGASDLPKTIFQSPYYSREVQVSAIEVGALGWLTSDNSSDEVLDQVRTVSQLEDDLDVRGLKQLFSEISVKPFAQLNLIHSLETRDLAFLKVLRLYTSGMAIRDLAKQASVSQIAVNRMLENFCAENGFMNRAQMLLGLHMAGLLSDG